MPDTAAAAAAHTAVALLEREYERWRIETLLEQLRSDGTGGLTVIEAAPGLGKTSLLVLARTLARERGLRSASARGHELEQEFGYGVTRQLLEPCLRGLSDPERRALMRGTAALARAVFDLGRPSVEDPFAIRHGLYWVVAELAARAPLVLLVDDCHWCDAPSLRFIAHLVNRLETVPVAIILATRPSPHGPTGQLLLAVSAAAQAPLLQPAPLTAGAVEKLARHRLGNEPDPAFLTACMSATGGNPFLLCELLGELDREGLEPSAAAAVQVAERAPATVARSVVARLTALGDTAIRVARAMAVLGERAEIADAAALAGIEPSSAAEAYDALTSAGIVAPGRPLRFSHPMVLRAVYDDLDHAERSRAHRKAAELLADADADPELIGAQLLLCDPVGDPNVPSHLYAAARLAAGRGAPETGISYLTRALQEPPCDTDRLTVVSELGRLELVLRRPCAADHLSLALDLSPDPVQRAQLVEDLADALSYTGSWDRGVPLLLGAIDELGQQRPELAMRLRAVLAAITVHDARFAGLREVILEEIDRLVSDGGAEVAPLLPVHALGLALEGPRCGEVAGLIRRAHADPRVATVLYRQQMLVGFSGFALLFADELDAAEGFAAAVAADAAARGSVAGFITASLHRADVRMRTGHLAEAQAEARPALELAAEHGAQLPHPLLIGRLALAALERGEPDDVLDTLLVLPLSADIARTGLGFMLLLARARVRHARGDAPGAIADLRLAGEAAGRLRVSNPNVGPWRSRLALLLAEEAPEEAEDLVHEELLLARRCGLPRSIGGALTARASLEGGDRQVATLEEAVSVLASDRTPLELARALIGLGRALRRMGRDKLAREPLRQALHIAERASARPLADRARSEAIAAGARPRRPWISGVEALTASELRVALMAAQGMSNREIAQTLFITPKTVGDHLASSYRKLDIHKRGDLARVLRKTP